MGDGWDVHDECQGGKDVEHAGMRLRAVIKRPKMMRGYDSYGIDADPAAKWNMSHDGAAWWISQEEILARVMLDSLSSVDILHSGFWCSEV